MQANNNDIFSDVKWDKIDEKKAEFIYNEAIARLDSIHKSVDVVTNKALGMLSFSVPVLATLTGFFILQLKSMSVHLLSISICAVIFLFAIIVLLLFVLLPRGLNSAQGEPKTYLSENYYLGSMEDIFKGNLQALQKSITEDMAILNLRGNLFKAAIILYAIFPLIATIVWVVVS